MLVIEFGFHRLNFSKTFRKVVITREKINGNTVKVV